MILRTWSYYLMVPLLMAWVSPCLGYCSEERRAQDGLTIDDLEDFLSALREEPAETGIGVSFRQLWEDTPRWQGKRVRLEGVVRRWFGQDAVGEFPALRELWVETDSGDWMCGVSPARAGMIETGDRVAFEGRFLRFIRYRSMDGDRLAPLIVGPEAPVKLAARAGASSGFEPIKGVKEWHVGAVLLVFVAFVLGAQHLKRRPATWTWRANLGADFWVEPEASGGSPPAAAPPPSREA